uniref:Uncharacterized protein n=1 Tax=Oryzias latipes TaxID=8090 RepID=A0A3B3HIS0_ORYLA
MYFSVGNETFIREHSLLHSEDCTVILVLSGGSRSTESLDIYECETLILIRSLSLVPLRLYWECLMRRMLRVALGLLLSCSELGSSVELSFLFPLDSTDGSLLEGLRHGYFQIKSGLGWGKKLGYLKSPLISTLDVRFFHAPPIGINN